MTKNIALKKINQIISLSNKNNLITNFILKKNLIWFFNNHDENDLKLLYSKASQIRDKYCGKKIVVRALIEISNYCSCECLYCGLNCKNSSLERYRLNKEEILSSIENISKNKIETLVMQAGEDFYVRKMMPQLLREIKEKYPNMAITLSLGEDSFNNYKLWKEKGADRYLLRIEASNPTLYKKLHNKKNVFTRKKCLSNLQKLGYQTGSGMMIGLPYQTSKNLAEDIIYFNKHNFDMIGIGPFIPHPETKFFDKSQGSVEMTLKAIALSRLILKDSWIPATTALGSLDKDYRIDAIKAGANVIMPNFSPEIYKKQYEIYPNKICIKEENKNAQNILEEISCACQLPLSFERNDRIKNY